MSEKKEDFQEIEELIKAVDWFSEFMKDRLAKKAKDGLRGWDEHGKKELIYSKLINKILETNSDGDPNPEVFVDMANFAMMLFRFKFILESKNYE